MFPLIQEQGTYESVDLLQIDFASDVVHDGPRAAPVRYVTFFLGGGLYGLPADEVAEVTYPLPVSPLPNAPEFLLGIAPLRGEIVAVVDLSRLVNEPPAASASRPKFVILHSTPGASQPAFRVDEMHELMTFGPEDLSRSDDAIFSFTTQSRGRLIKLIRTDAVRASLDSQRPETSARI